MHNKIAKNLNLNPNNVQSVLNLLNDGATVAFIARYRKELSGNLNEIDILNIIDLKNNFLKIEKRKNEVLTSLQNQNITNKKLINDIKNCDALQTIEDLYLPYKKTKQTKADIAIQQGFMPIAKILQTSKQNKDKYIANFAKQKNITVKECISFAGHIIAQQISHNVIIRDFLRDFIYEKAFWVCKLKDETLDKNKKYLDFYDYKAKVNNLKSHRILAILRAEKEKVISLKLELNYIPTGKIRYLAGLHKSLFYTNFIEEFVTDSFKRLIKPSLANELAKSLFEKAQNKACILFANNLKHLLLTPPLPPAITLGIDPGFKTGCKCAIINKNLNYLTSFNVYPHTQNKNQQAQILINECIKHKVSLVAIGNGSYSGETAEFVSEYLIKKIPTLKYVIVDEAGASIYSASKLAIDEFSSLDLTARSAISLARRVLNPISEFVKVPPQSLGIGMYQHDINQKLLQQKLITETQSAVNFVGANLNTASKYLLQYISGLNLNLATKIVEYRTKNNGFKTRSQLLEVAGLGKKTFLVAAGFCIIKNGIEPLDATLIHPESYEKTYKLLNLLGIKTINSNINEICLKLNLVDSALLTKINISNQLFELIQKAFNNYLFDARQKFPKPLLRSSVININSLKIGIKLIGIIKNITDFGLFIDIGSKNDAFMHIIKIKNRFLPRIGMQINVIIDEININRNRISVF